MNLTALHALLAELRERGVTIEIAQDGLDFFPLEATTPELREQIAEHRAGLIQILRAEAGQGPDTLKRGATPAALDNVERRLAALLEGRLWMDSDGWWPKDTGIASYHAAQMAAQAMATAPATDLPEPGYMTLARGKVAVHGWQQVVTCLEDELGWRIDRAVRVAALVVDPCFGLDLDASTDSSDALFERYLSRLPRSFLDGECEDDWNAPVQEVSITSEMFRGTDARRKPGAIRPPARCFNCRRAAGWWRPKGDPGPWRCQQCVPQSPQPDLDVWPLERDE